MEKKGFLNKKGKKDGKGKRLNKEEEKALFPWYRPRNKYSFSNRRHCL